MAHDFKLFPELTNSQMQFYYWDSPHKQITEGFMARVTKVTDGDTIRVAWEERDFTFPIRLLNLAAPELNETGGLESQRFLANNILGKEVYVLPDRTRVEKWGRLLADVNHFGQSMTDVMIDSGHAIAWADREIAW